MALLSAFFISVARTLYRGALMSLSPLVTTVIATIITSFLALGLYAMGEGLDHWPLYGVLWFVLVGMVGGLGGRYMGMISIKLVGLARTPILTQTGAHLVHRAGRHSIGRDAHPPGDAGDAGHHGGRGPAPIRQESHRKARPAHLLPHPRGGGRLSRASRTSCGNTASSTFHRSRLGMSISNTTTLTLLLASAFFFLPTLQMKSGPFTRHSLTIHGPWARYVQLPGRVLLLVGDQGRRGHSGGSHQPALDPDRHTLLLAFFQKTRTREFSGHHRRGVLRPRRMGRRLGQVIPGGGRRAPLLPSPVRAIPRAPIPPASG